MRYIEPPYTADGSGDALFVAAGAVLQVMVRAPAYEMSGRTTVSWGGAGTVITRPDQFDARSFPSSRTCVGRLLRGPVVVRAVTSRHTTDDGWRIGGSPRGRASIIVNAAVESRRGAEVPPA